MSIYNARTRQLMRSFFGKAGSPYDFSGVNLSHAREQCRELESQQKGMGKKINTKVMNMIDKYVLPGLVLLS